MSKIFNITKEFPLDFIKEKCMLVIKRKIISQAVEELFFCEWFLKDFNTVIF